MLMNRLIDVNRVSSCQLIFAEVFMSCYVFLSAAVDDYWHVVIGEKRELRLKYNTWRFIQTNLRQIFPYLSFYGYKLIKIFLCTMTIKWSKTKWLIISLLFCKLFFLA